jgi:DNA mismatch repair protein MutS
VQRRIDRLASRAVLCYLASVAGPKTPVMMQHAAAKRAYPDAIIFFRLGDFYEMFGDDAIAVSRLLDLTLTSRNRGKPDEVPMAGVPHHAAHGYVARLLELGHKVAICEQMADPAKTRGIVPREVVRVITPGLVTDGDQLDARSNNWLCAIDLGERAVGIALFDLSTAELAAAELDDLTALLGELGRAAPRELLLGSAGPVELGTASAAIRAALSRVALREDGPLDEPEILPALGELAEPAALLGDSARRAVARVLRFARGCNPGQALPVGRIGRWEPGGAMRIDQTAQVHLELVQSASGDRATTLLGTIDATSTSAGARLLRRRLLAPLCDVERIRRRLDAVELFVVHPRLRAELRTELDDVTDLERLGVRAALGQATPRDLGALRDGLAAAARTLGVLERVDDSSIKETLGLGGEPVDVVSELAERLSAELVDRPPAQAKDGAVFRAGFDAELDELDELAKSGTRKMVELEARLREATGIGSLKIRFTRVFGWYIEVSRSQLARVPETWRRKQTVASGERYTTDELDELADRITHAEERHRQRELDLLRQLVRAAGDEKERIARLATRLARWDVAAGLAEIAHRYDYARPVVDDSDVIEIADGRHPVVERLSAFGRFVPNDVRLESSGVHLWLVTGPNMAGKSTLLRQVALSVILAQIGGFVPAKRARIGVVDRVLSRVGASDNLARGESTFMVEMRETAEILRSATRRSLVILDEIGRGTSTFDGLAIAWAVAEHLDEVIGCRALFATHYHELTELAEASEHAENFSVSARELRGDLVFLHRLVPGAVSKSYGVAVAKLAGLPEPVLARARAILTTLESGDGSLEPGPRRRQRPVAAPQLDLFAARPAPSATGDEVLETLRALDVDRLTPLEALTLLSSLRQRLLKDGGGQT